MTASHPMQPLEVEPNGLVRFKQNAIVVYLMNNLPWTMDNLAECSFSDEDKAQFAQLLGCRVDGFGLLPYVSEAAAQVADAKAAELLAQRGG